MKTVKNVRRRIDANRAFNCVVMYMWKDFSLLTVKWSASAVPSQPTRRLEKHFIKGSFLLRSGVFVLPRYCIFFFCHYSIDLIIKELCCLILSLCTNKTNSSSHILFVFVHYTGYIVHYSPCIGQYECNKVKMRHD